MDSHYVVGTFSFRLKMKVNMNLKSQAINQLNSYLILPLISYLSFKYNFSGELK